MLLKTRRMNALLAPLTGLVDAEAAHGHLTGGSYNGYGVEARPRRGYPIQQAPTSEVNAPGQVDMFQLTLSDLPGRSLWRCQSFPGSRLQDAVSQFTAGRLLRGLAPGEFKFERVDTLREGEERLTAKLTGAPRGPDRPHGAEGASGAVDRRRAVR